MTQAVVEALSSGSARLFVFGVVSYDTFGKPHETEFCFIPNATDTQNVQTCAKWNNAQMDPLASAVLRA